MRKAKLFSAVKVLVLTVFLVPISTYANAEWGGEVTAAYVGNDGNYDTKVFSNSDELYAFSANLYRTTDYHEVNLSAKVLYDEYENYSIAEWYDLNDQHTLNKFDESGFTWSTHVTWDKNDFLNVEDRVEASIVGGYQLVYRDILVKAFAGPGAIYEDINSVKNFDSILRYCGEISTSVGPVDIFISVEHIYPVEDENDYRTDGLGYLQYNLCDNFGIRTGVVIEHQNNPIGPERTDIYSETGVVVSF